MSAPSYLLSKPAPMVTNLVGSEGSSRILFVSFAGWKAPSTAGLLLAGMSCWAMATLRMIVHFSSAMMRASASLEPAEAHSIDRLKQPATVITPWGPGIFVLRYA